jgi:hypothetical protein
MKTISKFTGAILLILTIALNGFSTETPSRDTLRIIINGELITEVDMNDIEALDSLDINIDSIMTEVESALDDFEGKFENIEIINSQNKKQIILKDASGEILEEFSIPTEKNEKEINEFRFEIEKSEKNLHPYMTIEIGSNNYLQENKFPSGELPYIVKPFGSWSFSAGSGMRVYASSWLSLDLGADLLWYNFKMEDRTVIINEGTEPAQIVFQPTESEDDPIRSKLRVSYINANLMPVFHIGKKSSGFNRRTFRIGVGGYAGYRIGSMTKYVYEHNGNKQKDKYSDNFYLNNFRYGAKAMIGIKEINVFLNYDLNSLFEENKGPEGNNLNAFSFGVNFTI